MNITEKEAQKVIDSFQKDFYKLMLKYKDKRVRIYGDSDGDACIWIPTDEGFKHHRLNLP